MKKNVLPILALLTASALLLVLAACTTVPSAPAATATTAPASNTPVAPATQAVPLTVQAPVSGTVPAPVEGQRPIAQVTPAERNDMFSGPADKYVESETVYVATIVTDKGNIVAELYQDTPESLNNFVTLALNGFYDGLTFHRVEPGFVIQGGDPLGQGNGGPGYTIPAEIKYPHPRGALAWARTSDEINPERESSGSQFYITLDQTQFLDGAYTVFGYVVEGMEVADQIAQGDKIQRIDIGSGGASKLPTPYPTASPTPVPTPTITPTPFAPASQDGRPLATVPVAEREDYYNMPPEMTIDTTKKYEATIDTDKGKIVMELDPSLAPNTVNNFVTLANLGFFDGMPVAFAQAESYVVFGSPKSAPDSDVGYTLPLEAAENTTVVTGTVAMYPVADPQGNPVGDGSQFFISFVAVPEGAVPMNIFGRVTEGLDVAQKLVGSGTDPTGSGQQSPAADIIKTITITEK